MYQGVVCRALLWCSVARGVVRLAVLCGSRCCVAPLLSQAPGAHTRWWIWMGRPAHCRPVTRSSPPPPTKSTSVSAVTQSYPRQPRKRLWRSNQLWLNAECDGSHYSKSSTATALTTIDYLNIACVRCRGSRAHLRGRSSQEGGCGPSSSSLLILPFICDDQDNISEEMSLCCIFSICSSSQLFLVLLFLKMLCTRSGSSDYTHSALLILYYSFQGAF